MHCYFIVLAEHCNANHQVTHDAFLFIKRVHQSEPASIDFMVSLEVNIRPIHLETANKWVSEDELFAVVDFEADWWSVQLLEGHTFEFEVKFLIEYRIIGVCFNLNKYNRTLVRWIWSLI